MDEIIWDEAPDPPVVGKVTHYSVELIWSKELLNKSNDTVSFTSSTSSLNFSRRSKLKYILQEEEMGGLVTKGYGTVNILYYFFHCVGSNLS